MHTLGGKPKDVTFNIEVAASSNERRDEMQRLDLNELCRGKSPDLSDGKVSPRNAYSRFYPLDRTYK
jgi:hypothetical protein